MNRRVSISWLLSRKFLTSTVPLGKSQSPPALGVTFKPSGNASQRSLAAPSDQKGAFGA